MTKLSDEELREAKAILRRLKHLGSDRGVLMFEKLLSEVERLREENTRLGELEKYIDQLEDCMPTSIDDITKIFEDRKRKERESTCDPECRQEVKSCNLECWKNENKDK